MAAFGLPFVTTPAQFGKPKLTATTRVDCKPTLRSTVAAAIQSDLWFTNAATSFPEGEFTRSYVSLCRDKKLVPRFEMRNQLQVTPPGGTFGARGSRLVKLLCSGHEGVELSTVELRRLAVWIDLNATFYGAYSAQAQARQLRREKLPMPEIQ